MFDTENIYIEAINRIKKDTKKSESKIIDLLIDFIVSMDSKGGKFLKTLDGKKSNKKQVARLNAELDKFLKKSGYTKSVTRFLTNFDEIDEHLRFVHDELNDIKIQKSFLNQIKKTAITKVTSDLVGNGLLQSFKDPIREVLFDAVVSGGSLTDVLRNVRNAIKTDPNNQGLILRHVTQISRDALQQYNGRQHNAIRRQFGLNGFLYVNSLVKDSRPQCKRWRKMEEIKFSELEKEIKWAFRNGKGMIPRTTKDTFIKFRGGYACRHEAIPKKV